MGLLKTLLHPDHEDDPERGQISHAANLLQVGEFQLLQLAFVDWYGREMTKTESDAAFNAFMLRGQAPAWLRSYARKIIDMEENGELDINNRRYHRYDNEYFSTVLPNGVRRFIVAVTIVTGVLGGGIAMASYTVSHTGKCTDMLPPCLTEAELQQSEAKD